MNNRGRNRSPIYGDFFSRYHDFSSFGSDKVDNVRKRLETIDPEKRLPVDQYCAQDFAVGSHGWPLSDLALLAKAQTSKEFEAAVARIRELNPPGVNNEGKTVAQVLDSVLPSWVKTPAEFQRYVAYYSSFGVDSSDKSVDPLVKDEKDEKESADS